MFKVFKEALYLDNIIINLINRYENVHLHLRYNIKEQKKIAAFKVLNDFCCYVILDASDQNRILKENLTDKNIVLQLSILT